MDAEKIAEQTKPKKLFDPSFQKPSEWERRYYTIKTHCGYCAHCRALLSRWRPRDEYGIHLFYRMAGLQCLYFFDYEILGYKDMLVNTHYALCEFVQSWDENAKVQQYKQIIMPRETFKSSVVTVGYSVLLLVQNPNTSILINNASTTKAQRFLYKIRQHFEPYPGNKLYEHYGNYVPQMNDPKRLWRESMIRVSRAKSILSDASVVVSGVMSSKTSQHYHYIINDDLHDEDNVQTKDQIDKVIWFRDSLGAILMKPAGRQIDIGTPWAEYDVLSDARRREPHLKCFKRGAYNTDGSLFFPTRLTEAVLSQQQAKLGSYRFSCQFLCDPLPKEDQKFKSEWFKHYINAPENLIIKTFCDPASGQGRDNCAIVTVGYDAPKETFYVLDIRYSNRWSETQVALEHGDVAARFSPRVMAMEAAALGTRYRNAIQKEFNRLGIRQSLEPVTADSHVNKKYRISGLTPLYEEGAILHRNEESFKALEKELLWFRMDTDSHADDIIDALSRCIALFDLTRRSYAIPRSPHPSWTGGVHKEPDNPFRPKPSILPAERKKHSLETIMKMKFHPRW